MNRSKSIRWSAPFASVVGMSLVGFSYATHGLERANERAVHESRIKQTLEAPDSWLTLQSRRYVFEKQFLYKRLRIVAKIGAGCWVCVVSVMYLNHRQVLETLRWQTG
jgi:hypothetical protein